MEALLISEVAAQTRAYQLQDLKCLKCRQVGCANISQLLAAPHHQSMACMSRQCQALHSCEAGDCSQKPREDSAQQLLKCHLGYCGTALQ